MNKYSPVFLLILIVGVLAVFLQGDRGTLAQAQVYMPVEGSLYKGHIDSLDKSDVPFPSHIIKLPVLNIYLKDLTSVGLPAQTKQFIALLVPESEAKAELMLPKKKHMTKRSAHSVVVISTPSLQAPVHEELKTPELSFSFFNVALDKAETSFALSNRFTKGAMTLQLVEIGKWKDLFLIKCSLANEGEKDFFISSLTISANERKIESDSYIPFSCPPHESVVGIVTFQVAAAVNKRVSVTMVQDGDPYEKLEIENVGYKF